jgi:hypothetical protein
VILNKKSWFVDIEIFFSVCVVGKSITTNPGYFSSGRFLNGEGVKRLLFSQLGSLVKD